MKRSHGVALPASSLRHVRISPERGRKLPLLPNVWDGFSARFSCCPHFTARRFSQAGLGGTFECQAAGLLPGGQDCGDSSSYGLTSILEAPIAVFQFL